SKIDNLILLVYSISPFWLQFFFFLHLTHAISGVMGKWGDGVMGKWGVGSGVMGKWGVGSGVMGKWGVGCGVWGVGCGEMG
ncbi:MAG: hypothetical protein RLZZ143_2233, partial [Cyanobacteriota bacterium]